MANVKTEGFTIDTTLHVLQWNVLEAEDFCGVVIGHDHTIHATNLGLQSILHERISLDMRLSQNVNTQTMGPLISFTF
jgi:hypothetical protein